MDCNPFHYTLANAGQLGFGFFAEFERKVIELPGKNRVSHRSMQDSYRSADACSLRSTTAPRPGFRVRRHSWNFNQGAVRFTKHATKGYGNTVFVRAVAGSSDVVCSVSLCAHCKL